MAGRVRSAVLLAGLVVLAAARPAAADVVYVGGTANDAVPLHLQIEEQRAELRVYRREDRVDLVAPLVVCQGNCAFKLIPGAYKLQLKGPPDIDMGSGSRQFDLRGPSSLYVEPPSSTARWLGLGMGILGPCLMVTGLALVAEGTNHTTRSYKNQEFAGGGLLLGGTMLTVAGWIVFGANGKPSLELQPLRSVGSAQAR